MIVNQMGGGASGESVEHFRGSLSVDSSNRDDNTASILRLPFKADYTLIYVAGSFSESFPLQYVSSGFGPGNISYTIGSYNRYYAVRPEGNVTVVKGYNPNGSPFVIYVEAFKLKE